MSSSALREAAAAAVAEVAIAAADQRVVVVTRGGGLRSYTAEGHDLLDGFAAGEPSRSGRGQVLIPWPNRLEDGTYTFNGHRHQVPVNEPERRNAIHGLVREAQWAVAEHEPHRVVVEHLLEPQPGYPFALSLRIEYAVSPAGLRVCTTATNMGAEPCPYGAGAHPYLTAGGATVDSATLRLPAHRVLRTDERGLPAGSSPVGRTDLDFTQPRRIGRTRLDHAFTDLERGADGVARAELQASRASRKLVLWVDEAYTYLMVFTGDPLPDVNRRSIAIEPMTCPPNAFRTGDGVIRLEPGESFRSVWGITPP